MEYEYFEKELDSWALNKYGSYWAITLYEVNTETEQLNEEPITYYNSCKIRIIFEDKNKSNIWYKVLVTDLGKIVFTKL